MQLSSGRAPNLLPL